MLLFVNFAAALTNYYSMLIFSIQCYFEVSPLDEFFFSLRANFGNKICLNKKKKKKKKNTVCVRFTDSVSDAIKRALGLWYVNTAVDKVIPQFHMKWIIKLSFDPK